MPQKNLTLKRLTRIMQDLAGSEEKVGEDSNCDVIVRKGSHLSDCALFVIIIEQSILFNFLNFDYAPSCAVFDEYYQKLSDALSEYGVHFEHYSTCVLHIYK